MIRMLLYGTVFGFVLSRVGVTKFDAIAEMFLLENLHVAGVIGVAVVVTTPGSEEYLQAVHTRIASLLHGK